MKKIFTWALAGLIALHTSVVLCACPHELDQAADHCPSASSEPSSSHTSSDHHHSHHLAEAEHAEPSPSHHHDVCSCIQQDESAMPSKTEFTSIDFHKHLAWIHSPVTSFFSSNFIVSAAFNSLYGLAPPESTPLYLKKNTFLI